MNAKHHFLGLSALLLAGSLFLTHITSSNSTQEVLSSNNRGDAATEVTLDDTRDPVKVAIKPPFKGVDIPFSAYEVSAKEGQVIKFETGTVITIPAEAFVDREGNPVEGTVNIEYREFHDAADLIVSGIIMQNNETGEYMETAGMFEMNGYHNGEQIFVKEGKSIQVDLASYNEGNHFDFFCLDQKEAKWDKKGTGSATPNHEKSIGLKKLSEEEAKNKEPRKPAKYGETDAFVFDLDVNYSKFPELKVFKGVVWEYSGDKEDKDNPENNGWVFEENWDGIDLKKSEETGNFVLTLNSRDKKFDTNVRPVLKGEDYETALAEFNEKMDTYTEIKEIQVAERERLEMQADLVRSFNVDGFGIHNWDVWKQPGRIQMVADVDCKKVVPENLAEYIQTKMDIFLVSNNKKSVVRYDLNTLDRFSFDPNQNNILIAVLPKNGVAVYSASRFNKLDIGQIKKTKQQLFDMAASGKTVGDVKDIRKIIENAG